VFARMAVAMDSGFLASLGPGMTGLRSLASTAAFGLTAAAMEQSTAQRRRRILWPHVLTVVSAAILISAEVFGAAFAGSWAIANLLALGALGARVLDGLFMACGVAVMVQFVRAAHRVEPFIAD